MQKNFEVNLVLFRTFVHGWKKNYIWVEVGTYTKNFLNEKVVIFSHMKLKTVDQLFKIENSNDITFKRIFNEDWFMYTKLKVVT